MESWRITFRDGFVPVLSTENLMALRDALRDDDKRLIQGSTSCPPPLMAVQDFPVEAGCALGFMGASENGGFCHDANGAPNGNNEAATVGETEMFFAKTCFAADQRLGEPAACRWFLNAYDSWDRDEMRRQLLPEVELALAARQEGEQPITVEA